MGNDPSSGDPHTFGRRLAGAKAGEAWAVAELYRDLQPRLWRFLRAQEPGAADDVAAEVWEAVARAIGRFEGGEPQFRAWVFTIARRRLVEHRRRTARRRTEPTQQTLFEALAGSGAPESEAIANLSAQHAVELIRTILPADQAEVVLLRVLGDLGVTEVTDIMDRTENWVRVTQHRALRRLADRIGSKLDVTR